MRRVLLERFASMKECNPGLTKRAQDVYTSIMQAEALEKQPATALFDLPCACQNLRRVTRVVTRIYDQELMKAGLEITQFGLLTALAATGETNQKQLSAGFAMDSTTLTRTLGLVRRQGWIRVRRGKDRRERLFRLTQAGKRQMAEAQPYWERVEQRLRRELDRKSTRLNSSHMSISYAVFCLKKKKKKKKLLTIKKKKKNQIYKK